jgi:amino acid transporter
VLTTVAACGAVPFERIAARPADDGPVPVDYPLAEVLRLIPAGGSDALFYGFCAVALVGLVASYHGLLYGSSRQLFALGRDGFLPVGLGAVNPSRRTPVAALAATSLLTAGFEVANLWFEQAVAAAVLVAGFAALVLYLLSMGALARLRRREPGLLAGYRAPLGWWLPLGVVVLSAVALLIYPRIDATGVVVPAAVGMYLIGAVGFAALGRVQPNHDEEAEPAAPQTSRRGGWLHRAAVGSLVLAVGVIGAVAVAALGGPALLGPPTDGAAVAVLATMAGAIVAVAAVELRTTRQGKP